MQNKKSLLQRLLVIYITFFIVLVASIAHGFLPDFSKGYSEGSQMGNDIVKSWMSGTPRRVYMLSNIAIANSPRSEIALDSVAAADRSVEARIGTLCLTVEEDAPGASVMGIAFGSIGGSPWLYLLTVLNVLAFAAIIVLMILIIHSLRRSIREEHTLDKRNVWMLRTIGLLTILTELFHDIVNWRMAQRAAEVLAGSGYAVETGFRISYSTVIMGILVLFAAEVFAIGQNLSEEQKLTI
ncbi:DUF2975 domain-containing protein [Alistipes sp.]|uniref:DUF2975 domain-containing protein n=1 Tax=Alistipes sp. TaxID=1872444 RepID=UPI003AF139E4